YRDPRRVRHPHPSAPVLSATHLAPLARARRAARGQGARRMMTLPAVDVLRPRTVAEAIAHLAAHPGARVLAGGTDIVPNLKYGMYEKKQLMPASGQTYGLRPG